MAQQFPLNKSSKAARRTQVLILGAAGRDFHNFNVVFRDNPGFNVAAFTAAQIMGIAGRTYPGALAGKAYPDGITIYDEKQLPELIRKLKIDVTILAYSDISHKDVMHKASIVTAAGASFALLGPDHTMLKSRLPVIAICAVRTGAGKSPMSRRIVRWAIKEGFKPAVVRHPMPYGDLKLQSVQRFTRMSDLDKAQCTVEEREEYEPYIKLGVSVYSGVDYGKILKEAEKSADFILWDGGNNDFPFYRPDLHITLVDPHRPGHELEYYPGETNYRMADLLVITKADSAPKEGLKQVLANTRKYRPGVPVVLADLAITLDNPEAVRGKRVLIIEDGPTITHGGSRSGAGMLAATRYGAKAVDPRQYARGSIKKVFSEFPHIGRVLPAMGYNPQQVADLESTINAVPCDAVLVATPINLAHLVKVKKPIVRVSYEFEERGSGLAVALKRFAGLVRRQA